MRRNVPSGRSRATPDSAVPAQSNPDGDTSTERTWFDGSPVSERKIFSVAPVAGSMVTMPPRVPMARSPLHETIAWISFELM